MSFGFVAILAGRVPGARRSRIQSPTRSRRNQEDEVTRRTRFATIILLTLLLAACVSDSATDADGRSSNDPTGSASDATGSTTDESASSGGSKIPAGELQGTILFLRAGGKWGDATVFTANADGSHVERITPFGEQCCPHWLPDGSRILISALSPDGRITTGIIDPDGSNHETIPLPPGTLNLGCAEAVSAATGQLACEGWDDDDPDARGVYVIDGLDGSGVTRVTDASHGSDADRPLGFSADGSQVFFFRPDPTMPNPIDEPVGSLWVVGVDGSDEKRITPAHLPVQVTGAAGGRVSPDGEWIVFSANRILWKVRTDGTDVTQVYEDPQGRIALTPTWSPDGGMIMFALIPSDMLPILDVAPPSEIDVVRVDGSGLTTILATDDWNLQPDWSAVS